MGRLTAAQFLGAAPVTIWAAVIEQSQQFPPHCELASIITAGGHVAMAVQIMTPPRLLRGRRSVTAGEYKLIAALIAEVRLQMRNIWLPLLTCIFTISSARAQSLNDYDLSVAYCLGLFQQNLLNTQSYLSKCKSEDTIDCDFLGPPIKRMKFYVVLKLDQTKRNSKIFQSMHKGKEDSDLIAKLDTSICSTSCSSSDSFGECYWKCEVSHDHTGALLRNDGCWDVIKKLPN